MCQSPDVFSALKTSDVFIAACPTSDVFIAACPTPDVFSGAASKPRCIQFVHRRVKPPMCSATLQTLDVLSSASKLRYLFIAASNPRCAQRRFKPLMCSAAHQNFDVFSDVSVPRCVRCQLPDVQRHVG
ncbi:hypothetical protein J6590_086956 [Homalodisca vitripennis]|nr:hypothetical protein J6590_086956 [Homalodisca vitripennis]